MQRIAVYGKGGIGKSTISSNLTAALSDIGVKVMQIGCDPKHDSTRLLTGGNRQETVLEYLKDVPEPHRKMADVVEEGYKGCLCVEAGGPEPGIGCAGRGIISAFELLHELGVDSIPLDIITYDVLGDVVCGGFAVPLRNNYADVVYIVTSGEFMSIYAANNILRGTANYNPDRIGGIIFNSRGDEEEHDRVVRFSKAVGIPVIAEFSRSKEFLEAERMGMTVVEAFPDSEITKRFRELAKSVLEGRKHTARFLSETELENVVLGRDISREEKFIPSPSEDSGITKAKEKRRYTSRNVNRNEILHGCAFNGASSVTLSIGGLTTVYHSPRSCAQYAFRMAPNSVKRSTMGSGVNGNIATVGNGMGVSNGNVGADSNIKNIGGVDFIGNGNGCAGHGACNRRSPRLIRTFADPSVGCTEMNERDMIFGGSEGLERKLNDLIGQGRNDIAVITSCPSGIIGDDVPQVISKIKNKHPNVTIMLLEEDGNVRGDFMQGVIDASMTLIKELAVKDLEKKDSVNVVGVKTLSTNCNRNLDMVAEILNRMGVELNCSCVGSTGLDSIRSLTSAKISMLLYPDRFALMLRDFLVDEYDMEFTKNIVRPGMAETRSWITEIGTIFGREDAAEQIVKEMESEFEQRIDRLRNDLKGRSVYIVGMHKDVNWIMETALGCGMDVLKTVVMETMDHLEDYDLNVDYPIEHRTYAEVDAIREDIIAKDPDMILTVYPIDVDIDAEQCFIPISPDLGPFSGPNLAETWVRMLKAPSVEGWRLDVIRS